MTPVPMTSIPTVQIGRPGWERHGDQLRHQFPQVAWLIVHADRLEHLTPDGTISHPEWDDANADVVWMDLDVVRSDLQGRHFALAASGPPPQWVHASYAGLDGAYWSSLVDKGTIVTGSHISGIPMAQYVMGQVLQWFHAPAGWPQARASKTWRAGEFQEIADTTWVVVGMGDIGGRIATLAQAFGASVTGVRRTPVGDEPCPTVPLGQLPDLAPTADVIVFAIPGGPSTDGMVDAGFLARLRPNAVIVNVGRGTLVNEPDLLEALDADQLAGAIVDVTATEPLPDDHWMWDHPKVMLTPHVSAAGTGRHQRSVDAFTDNLRRWLDDEALPYRL